MKNINGTVVIDGDTVIVNGERMRLSGADAYETLKIDAGKFTTNPQTPLHHSGAGEVATRMIERELEDGAQVIPRDAKDHHGRTLYDMDGSDGTDVTAESVRAGVMLGTPYSGTAETNAARQRTDDIVFGRAWTPENANVAQAQEEMQFLRDAGVLDWQETTQDIAWGSPIMTDPNMSWSHTLGKAFSRGVTGLEQAAGGLGFWLGDMVGSDDLKEWGKTKIHTTYLDQVLNPAAVESYEQINLQQNGGWDRLAKYVIEGVGEALPSLLPDMVAAAGGAAMGAATANPAGVLAGAAGGASLRRGLLKYGMDKLSDSQQQVAKRELAKLIARDKAKRAATGGAIAGAVSMGGQGAGGTQSHLAIKGLEEVEGNNMRVALAGIGIGAANIGPARFLSKHMTKLGMDGHAQRGMFEALKNAGMMTVEGAAVESIASPLSALVEDLAIWDAGGVNPLDSDTDYLDVFFKGVLGGAGMGGTVGGAGMAQTGINTLLDKYQQGADAPTNDESSESMQQAAEELVRQSEPMAEDAVAENDDLFMSSVQQEADDIRSSEPDTLAEMQSQIDTLTSYIQELQAQFTDSNGVQVDTDVVAQAEQVVSEALTEPDVAVGEELVTHDPITQLPPESQTAIEQAEVDNDYSQLSDDELIAKARSEGMSEAGIFGRAEKEYADVYDRLLDKLLLEAPHTARRLSGVPADKVLSKTNFKTATEGQTLDPHKVLRVLSRHNPDDPSSPISQKKVIQLEKEMADLEVRPFNPTGRARLLQAIRDEMTDTGDGLNRKARAAKRELEAATGLDSTATDAERARAEDAYSRASYGASMQRRSPLVRKAFQSPESLTDAEVYAAGRMLGVVNENMLEADSEPEINATLSPERRKVIEKFMTRERGDSPIPDKFYTKNRDIARRLEGAYGQIDGTNIDTVALSDVSDEVRQAPWFKEVVEAVRAQSRDIATVSHNVEQDSDGNTTRVDTQGLVDSVTGEDVAGIAHRETPEMLLTRLSKPQIEAALRAFGYSAGAAAQMPPIDQARALQDAILGNEISAEWFSDAMANDTDGVMTQYLIRTYRNALVLSDMRNGAVWELAPIMSDGQLMDKDSEVSKALTDTLLQPTDDEYQALSALADHANVDVDTLLRRFQQLVVESRAENLDGKELSATNEALRESANQYGRLLKTTGRVVKMPRDAEYDPSSSERPRVDYTDPYLRQLQSNFAELSGGKRSPALIESTANLLDRYGLVTQAPLSGIEITEMFTRTSEDIRQKRLQKMDMNGEALDGERGSTFEATESGQSVEAHNERAMRKALMTGENQANQMALTESGVVRRVRNLIAQWGNNRAKTKALEAAFVEAGKGTEQRPDTGYVIRDAEHLSIAAKMGMFPIQRTAQKGRAPALTNQDALAKVLGVTERGVHTALGDTRQLMAIHQKLMPEQANKGTHFYLDTEATDNNHQARMTEIAVIETRDGKVVGEYTYLVNPGAKILANMSEGAQSISGLSPDFLMAHTGDFKTVYEDGGVGRVEQDTVGDKRPPLRDIIKRITSGEGQMVAQNAAFDVGLLNKELQYYKPGQLGDFNLLAHTDVLDMLHEARKMQFPEYADTSTVEANMWFDLQGEIERLLPNNEHQSVGMSDMMRQFGSISEASDPSTKPQNLDKALNRFEQVLSHVHDIVAIGVDQRVPVDGMNYHIDYNQLSEVADDLVVYSDAVTGDNWTYTEVKRAVDRARQHRAKAFDNLQTYDQALTDSMLDATKDEMLVEISKLLELEHLSPVTRQLLMDTTEVKGQDDGIDVRGIKRLIHSLPNEAAVDFHALRGLTNRALDLINKKAFVNKDNRKVLQDYGVSSHSLSTHSQNLETVEGKTAFGDEVGDEGVTVLREKGAAPNALSTKSGTDSASALNAKAQAARDNAAQRQKTEKHHAGRKTIAPDAPSNIQIKSKPTERARTQRIGNTTLSGSERFRTGRYRSVFNFTAKAMKTLGIELNVALVDDATGLIRGDSPAAIAYQKGEVSIYLDPATSVAEQVVHIGHELGHILYDQYKQKAKSDTAMKEAYTRYVTDFAQDALANDPTVLSLWNQDTNGHVPLRSWVKTHFNHLLGEGLTAAPINPLSFEEWFADQAGANLRSQVYRDEYRTLSDGQRDKSRSPRIRALMSRLLRQLRGLWNSIESYVNRDRPYSGSTSTEAMNSFMRQIITNPDIDANSLESGALRFYDGGEVASLRERGNTLSNKLIQSPVLLLRKAIMPTDFAIRQFSPQLGRLLNSRAGDKFLGYQQRQKVVREQALSGLGVLLKNHKNLQAVTESALRGQDSEKVAQYHEFWKRFNRVIRSMTPHLVVPESGPIVWDAEAMRDPQLHQAVRELMAENGTQLNEDFMRYMEDTSGQPDLHISIRPGTPYSGSLYGEVLNQNPELRVKLLEMGAIRVPTATDLTRFVGGMASRAAWNSTMGMEVDGTFYPSMKIDVLTRNMDKNGKDYHELMNAVKATVGQLGQNINPTARKLSNAMLTYQAWRVLMFSGVSSLPETMLMLTRTREFKQAFSGLREAVKATVTNRDEAKQMAETFGTITETIIENSLQEIWAGGQVDGVSRQALNMLFAVNGQNALVRWSRKAGTVVANDFIKNHAARAELTGDPRSVRYLDELGLTHSDVKAYWQKVEKNGGNLLESDDPNRPDFALAQKYQRAIHRYVGDSVLTPNTSQVPPWMSDPRFAIFASLKKYFYYFGHHAIGGTMTEMARRRGESGAAGVAEPMMLMMMVLMPIAALGYELREWLKYFDEDKLPHNTKTNGEFAWQAFQRTGALGPVDVPYSAMAAAEFGANPIAAFASPTTSHINSLWKAFFNEDARGEHNPRLQRMLFDSTPIVNQSPWLKQKIREHY
ncbi:hypothetical protein ACPV5S_15675 [Vibrio astriarenae]